MSLWKIIRHSLAHHWRIHGAVGLGIAAATAVLAGALLVGDSVRGSLRDLVLDRLGQIDQLLIADRFFREELAAEVRRDELFQRPGATVLPAIVFPNGVLEHRREEKKSRTSNVLVVGCGPEFWELDDRLSPNEKPVVRGPHEAAKRQVVLNEPLAEDLGARVGDQVTLRLAKIQNVPADSPLGRKTDLIESLTELEVVAIVPARGLGRFALQSSQSVPRNAYVPTSVLQEALDQPGKVNTLIAANVGGERSIPVSPSCDDFGFQIRRVTRSFSPAEGEPEQIIYDYFQLTSERMILDREAEMSIKQGFTVDYGQPVLTYLANLIERVPAESDDASRPRRDPVAYSTVSALDPTPAFELTDVDGQSIGPLRPDEIVLTEWTRQALDARVGDTIRLTYFEPESTHGVSAERVQDFRLKAVLPLTEPSEPYRRKRSPVFTARPTPYNDPDLTPTVKGITDQESISKWEAPFKVDYDRVKKQDDDYWANHRTTPKAYVSLATGQRLWGSRFGSLTSVRIPAREGLSEESLKTKLVEQLARDGVRLGFEFRPVKREALRAASGTTPFDVLFLALSTFVIAAALLLVFLLFRLGVERRANELGLLLAVGWPRRRVTRLLVAEGTAVAVVGGLLGLAIGVGYARLMLYGLTTWWIGAIGTPFLEFHYTERSLAIGYLLGVAISAVTIAWSVRQTRHSSVRQLLAGQTAESGVLANGGPRSTLVVLACLIVAAGLAGLATRLGGEAQAGAFVAGGAAVLMGILIWLRTRVFAPRRPGSRSAADAAGEFDLPRLAIRNAGRNPGRSTVTIALMASASFLIVAMSSFQLAPTEQGTGGFDLLAESSQPVFEDLNDPEARDELFGQQQETLRGSTILSLRLRSGDDASCTNLYQATQPRVLGVTRELIDFFDQPDGPRFAFAASAATTTEERANPWRLLETDAPVAPSDAIPVVLDKNTAMYSLQMYRGIGEEKEFVYHDGTRLRIRVVGLLSNSVLQGSLLIGEAAFKARFPNVSGYRFFLVRSGASPSDNVAEVLEDRLGDEGFDAVSSRNVLAGLLEVQNTYLSTFQSLGALGLLLGSVGLTAVQLRNIFERRAELALLRAAGFRRGRLAGLVLLENVALLVGGLATGTLAAMYAVLPHIATGGAAVTIWQIGQLGVVLGVVLLVGFVTSLLAVASSLSAPILSALRGD